MYLIKVLVLLAKTPKQTKTTKMQHWEQCLKYMLYMPENVCFDFLLLRQK